MKKWLSLLLVTLSLNYYQAYAQPKNVTGVVTSAEDGLPVIGATVLEKGTSKGTITDLEGRYSIMVQEGATLIFRFVGLEDQEVLIGNAGEYNVTLRLEAESLDEVVVIGYGTRKKRDMVGSVATVTAEELSSVPASSLTQALQGKAAGVQISSSSGVPGSQTNVLIRGVNSISLNTSPLYIIDGMPIYSGGGLERTIGSTSQDPMSLINVNDIESIQILKDAEATSIYGSRGSNGVILITTKSGKNGQSQTNIDYSTGVTTLTRTPEDIGFTNTKEWFALVDKARVNSGLQPFDPFDITKFFRDNPLSAITREQALQINTNWFDQILRTGNYQDLNVSSSRGGEKSSLFASLSYNDTKGNTMENFFTRASARVNMDFNPIDHLKVGTRISLSYTHNSRVQQQVGGATGNNSGGASAGFGNANRVALPWFPIYDPVHPSGYWNPMSGANLVASLDPDHHFDEVEAYRGIGTVFAEYSIPFIKGLTLRTEAGTDFIQNNSIFWVSSILREDGSYAADRAVTRTGTNYNVYGNYNRQYGENHSVTLTFGSEWTRERQFSRNMEGQNLTGTYRELGNPQTILSISSGLSGEEYLWGYIGRGQYKFKDRYILGFSLRRDASSRFSQEYRWEVFPAFSAGWIISDEPFLKDNKYLNLLKLRGSFGSTGNKAIPANRFVTSYSNNQGDRYGVTSLISGGSRISNIGTPTLTWETTNSYDAGIDLGILKNRITGSIAWYLQDVTDLLLFSELPPSSGVNGIWDNIGDMRNFGWEISLQSVNIQDSNRKIKWSTSFNLTTNDNKVLALTPKYDAAGKGVDRNSTKSVTGKELWTYYMAEWAGVDKEKGIDMIYEIDYALWEQTGKTIKTGRIIPATQTNLSRNRVLLEGKTSVPRFFGGIDNSFTWRNFDLGIFFQFTGGHYFYDYEEQRTTSVQYGQVVLRSDMIGNTWEKPGDDKPYPELRWDSKYDWGWDINKVNPEWTGDPNDPRAKGYWTNSADGEAQGIYNNESSNYSKYLYKGDYIRLKTIQLGYTLPSSFTSRMKIKNLRIFVTGSNLWTFTREYKGWDPETGGGQLPLLQVYNAGLNLKF